MKRRYKLNKALREALLYLGPDYTTKVIDWELCLYRNLGNSFDIEVSGLRSEAQRGRICNFICVWNWPGIGSVEYVRGDGQGGYGDHRNAELKNLADLKRELDSLVAKYGNASNGVPKSD